jgi:hypothetical protein
MLASIGSYFFHLHSAFASNVPGSCFVTIPYHVVHYYFFII